MGRYIERADIEKRFGVKNTKTYADLDGDGNLVNIQAVIDSAITESEDEVDNRFRGGRYVIPFSPVPTKVEEWAAIIAGVALYQARGIRDTDTDNRMNGRLDTVDAEIKAHNMGTRQLVAALDGNQPNIPLVS